MRYKTVLIFFLGTMCSERALYSIEGTKTRFEHSARAVEDQSMPHTKHIVTANKDMKCRLASVYEKGFYFVDLTTGMNVSDFLLSANKGFHYGLVLGIMNDFNMRYSLACRLKDGKFAHSPESIFIVGAKGPADPDIRVLNYFNATGSWRKVEGIGENFHIELK